MNLFCNHEKEYFKKRSPKSITPSKNSAVIKVGGIGNDTGANEKFVWGGYEAASSRAKQYLISPLPQKLDAGRYRLEWL